MHTKLFYFLLTVIILGSIFIGMTVNKNHIIQEDYIEKQEEINEILGTLLDHMDSFENTSLSENHYEVILKYFYQAKEQTVLQVADLKEPIDSKTRLIYEFINKTNAVMIYICSSIKDNHNIWDEEYFSMVVELIKRMDHSIAIETFNYSKMQQVLDEMEVLITLL